MAAVCKWLQTCSSTSSNKITNSLQTVTISSGDLRSPTTVLSSDLHEVVSQQNKLSVDGYYCVQILLTSESTYCVSQLSIQIISEKGT